VGIGGVGGDYISITARTTLDKGKRVTEAVPIHRTSPIALAVTTEAKRYLYHEILDIGKYVDGRGSLNGCMKKTGMVLWKIPTKPEPSDHRSQNECFVFSLYSSTSENTHSAKVSTASQLC